MIFSKLPNLKRTSNTISLGTNNGRRKESSEVFAPTHPPRFVVSHPLGIIPSPSERRGVVGKPSQIPSPLWGRGKKKG